LQRSCNETKFFEIATGHLECENGAPRGLLSELIFKGIKMFTDNSHSWNVEAVGNAGFKPRQELICPR